MSISVLYWVCSVLVLFVKDNIVFKKLMFQNAVILRNYVCVCFVLFCFTLECLYFLCSVHSYFTSIGINYIPQMKLNFIFSDRYRVTGINYIKSLFDQTYHFSFFIYCHNMFYLINVPAMHL